MLYIRAVTSGRHISLKYKLVNEDLKSSGYVCPVFSALVCTNNETVAVERNLARNYFFKISIGP